jgi:hypothetical protein
VLTAFEADGRRERQMAEPTSAMVRRPCRSGIFLTLGSALAMFRGPATRRPSGRLTKQSKAASASGGKSSWPSPNPTAGSCCLPGSA